MSILLVYGATLLIDASNLNQQLSLCQSSNTRAMEVRILGYLLREASSPQAVLVLRRKSPAAPTTKQCAGSRRYTSIISFAAVRKIHGVLLASFFTCQYPVRSAKGHTPAPSHHPSRPSWGDTQEMVKYLLRDAPLNHSTANQKAHHLDKPSTTKYHCVDNRRSYAMGFAAS